MPTILVDVDDVLCSWLETLLARMAEAGGPRLTPEDVRHWSWRDNFGDDWAAQWERWLDSPDLYDDLDWLPGAEEGVHRLRGLGRVVAVSAATAGHASSKLRWLLERFEPRDIVLAADKALVGGNLLIEDSPRQVGEWVATGRPAVLFDRPWNRGYDLERCVRVRGWTECVRAVSELLGYAGLAP
jgi:5'(3')-deoxyribonucleotidase